jgi:queuine tRNA-ribosyltransferase
MSVLRLEITASDGAARCGIVHTTRGAYRIPAFMPVGTRGPVKALDSTDLEELGVTVVLANAFHLMQRPGAATVAALGGIHRFTGFGGHVLTDSGGFQVHSLGPKVDDDGMTFASVYDGSAVRLTPETAVEAQGLIGADIQMVLDVCASLPAGRDELRLAVDRTADWAVRARRRHRQLEERPEGQAIFGIVQGGCEADLRAESAARTVECDFDGYAVGGLSVGEPRPAMLEALGATVPHLPRELPRYLMGVGDPVGLVESVALGIDQFDCVGPTRMARHGTVLTRAGRLHLRNAASGEDDRPLDAACTCPTCARYSRGYLRHVLTVGEPTAWRLLSLHNLFFVLAFMDQIRDAVATGTLARLRERTAEVWDGAAGERL